MTKSAHEVHRFQRDVVEIVVIIVARRQASHDFGEQIGLFARTGNVKPQVRSLDITEHA